MPDRSSQTDQDRLKALEAKIAAAKGDDEAPVTVKKDYSQLTLAWRMVIELVSGIGIGFFIGFGLDSLFGTLPIFLVIFLFLGLAAGVRTMMRTAQEVDDGQPDAQMSARGTESGE